MKCTFLLCIIFHFFSLTAMDTPWESPYRAIDRIKDFFKKNNNMFNPKPTQLEGPIDEKMVLDTPYLQEILKATQEKKDEASEIMSQFRLYNSNADWAVERSYLAAAALCGGKKGLGRCLESATRAQDFHLCQLLLDHGAKPGTLLAHVRSVKLAELFLAHNASVIMDKDISYCGLLCDVAGSEKYEAGLIPLYRKHGLSPLKGPSPLLALLDSIDGLPSAPSVQEKSILDKAQYLLADLSPKDTLNFLFRYPSVYESHILTELKRAIAPRAIASRAIASHRADSEKMIKINLYNLLLKIKSDAELKLGKLGFNFDYSKLTNFAIHPYYKEKRVVTYTIITFEEHNKE